MVDSAESRDVVFMVMEDWTGVFSTGAAIRWTRVSALSLIDGCSKTLEVSSCEDGCDERCRKACVVCDGKCDNNCGDDCDKWCERGDIKCDGVWNDDSNGGGSWAEDSEGV